MEKIKRGLCAVCGSSVKESVGELMKLGKGYDAILNIYPQFTIPQIVQHKKHVSKPSKRKTRILARELELAGSSQDLQIGRTRQPREGVGPKKVQNSSIYTEKGRGSKGPVKQPSDRALEPIPARVSIDTGRAFGPIQGGPEDRQLNYIICIEEIYNIANKVKQLSEELGVYERIEALHRAGLLYKEVAKLYELGVAKGFIESNDRSDMNEMKDLFKSKPVLILDKDKDEVVNS